MNTPKTANKRFYSCLDASCSQYVPQSVQHTVNANEAKRQRGVVIFYTSEDIYTLHTQEVIRAKLNENPDVDGFIFYQLSQFAPQDRINMELIRSFLRAGYELHFSREQISIRSEAQLHQIFTLIYISKFTKKRDSTREFHNACLN